MTLCIATAREAFDMLTEFDQILLLTSPDTQSLKKLYPDYRVSVQTLLIWQDMFLHDFVINLHRRGVIADISDLGPRRVWQEGSWIDDDDVDNMEGSYPGH
jgi:hypothetical protein